MVIQLASDLHTETHADGGAGILAEMAQTSADLLVLAGDITNARDPTAIEFILRQVSSHYRDIIYIPGNHEFYGTTPAFALANLQEVAKRFANVHVPSNEVIVVGAKRFLCGTGWFPKPKEEEMAFKRYMNDFWDIEDFEPWVYEQHAHFRLLLIEELVEGDVVITHHLPSVASVSEAYKSAVTNAFFVSHFDKSIIMRKPALWLHGHTHAQCDYQLGATRVVANPLGYPNEVRSSMEFNSALTLTV